MAAAALFAGGLSSMASPAGAVSETLVINEVDYDQASTDTAEFIELKNTSNGSLGLDGISLELVNGSNGSIYQTIALPDVSLDAGDYFVVCGNAANVVNCDLDVSPDSNLIQNGDPDGMRLVSGNTTIDALSYEGDTAGATEGTGAGLFDSTDAGIGISRCPDGVDTDANNADFSVEAITPGAVNDCEDDGGGDTTEPAVVQIHEIQGTGEVVAIEFLVSIKAIVTGDFAGDAQLGGFFVQEPDLEVDGTTASSEGIFVYCGACEVDVNVGDEVTVIGLPEDFFGMTQIDATEAGGSVTIESSGNPLPTPTVISLPAAGDTKDSATFENTEGMLVTFSDTLVVSEYFQLARYGELVLTADARPAQFTDANDPDVAGYAAFLADLGRKRIILDDDNNQQNHAISGETDEAYYWPRPGLSNTNRIRGGDSISGLTGVMHWSFAGQTGTDAWRIRPVEPAFDYSFTSQNPAPTSVPDVGGDLTVASFNVLNYFTTINARGADSAAELDRQRTKISAAICALDADIVGLIEIENNGDVAMLDLLDGPAGVNQTCGGYAHVSTGSIGTDEIAVGFIYKPATVSLSGTHAVLDSSVDPRFVDSKNRPALAQTFESGGADVTVVVNHLKSKGSDCDELGDPDLLDGQANCNGTRADAAAAMVDWLDTDPTGSGDEDFLIIGDLNAYRNEDPIKTIEAGGYTDLIDAFGGASAYSYVFDGQLGYLDHALANDVLTPQVTGAAVWHINADEIPVFDYNDEIDDGSNESSFERESAAEPIFEPNALRSSDHDPVLIGLALDVPVLGICNGLEPTIIGTEGNDILTGTPGPDVISGLGGNDRIFGQGGDDVICGGEGDDELRGSLGDDRLFGEAGNDRLFGDAGDDTLFGGDDDDLLEGGLHADSLHGDDGNDTLRGGSGDDVLDGGDDDDVLQGGTQNDVADGGLGNDTVNGDAGNDTLTGGDGIDSADGSTGTDSCTEFETLVRCELP